MEFSYDPMSLSELQSLIDKADSSYYRTNLQPIVSDEVYDSLKNQLRLRNPSDQRLSRVGVPYSEEELRTKISHTMPMGSLDNIDEKIEGFEKWYVQNCVCSDKSIYASLKVDGSSVRAKYVDGILVHAATRGNGYVGEDITANAVNFKGLPTSLNIPVNCDVRGEAILFKEDFKKIVEKENNTSFDNIDESDISNPRNYGNGIIGRDNGVDSDKINFLVFNIVVEGMSFDTHNGRLKYAQELGFDIVPYKLCNGPDVVKQVEDFYNRAIVNRDTTTPFETDGIVVCINDINHQNHLTTEESLLRPKFARAIKFPNKLATTVLESVTLTVGHTGAIVPTANLKTVRIGGVNVEHALLNNWDEIDRLNIAINDEVTVTLSGDIIPKVLGVSKNSDFRVPITEPTNCPSCGSHTTRMLRGKRGAITFCSNPQNCESVLRAKVDKWIGGSKTGVGILGIGDAILHKLYESGLVKDPSDLYLLTVDQLKDLDIDGIRVGESRAKTIVQNIQTKKNLSLEEFLGSLGIQLLGKRRVKLLKKSAKGRLDDLNDWLDADNFNNLNIEGLGTITKNSISEGIQSNIAIINKLLANGVTIISDRNNSNSTERPSKLLFDGLSFCFTGTRECIQEVEKLGGIIKSSVSKNLDFLVQKDPTSSSGKTKKAESYDVKIISIDYLRKMIAENITATPKQSPKTESHPKFNSTPKHSPAKPHDHDTDDLVDHLLDL